MADVYVGHWTDRSRGSILGPRITLTSASGNTLIAFIAVFVSFVGTVTWNMLAYTLHQLRVSPKAKDGLHYQIQELLRNGHSPENFTWRILNVGFAWRKSRLTNTFRRTCGLAIVALSIYGLFVTSGILLSMVAETGFVLLKAPFVGYIGPPSTGGTFAQELFQTLVGNSHSDALIRESYNYASSCYSGTSDICGISNSSLTDPTSNCNYFVKPVLAWNTSFPGECPFTDPTVCYGPLETNVIRLDTGYLSTSNDLGINSLREESMFFRRVTTCAPLVQEGFSSGGFVDDPTLGKMAIYNYGNAAQVFLTPWQNGSDTFYYPYTSYEATNQAYELQQASTDISYLQMDGSSRSGFIPDARLGPNGSSITLIFLANRAMYQAPIEDPWFNATTELPSSSPLGSGMGPLYYSEEPAHVLGCVNEYEICNYQKVCLALQSNDLTSWYNNGGFTVDDATLKPLNLTCRQVGLASAIYAALYRSNYGNIVKGMGSTILVAYKFLLEVGSPLSMSLWPTQWEAEVMRFQAISMALMQRNIVSVALQSWDGASSGSDVPSATGSSGPPPGTLSNHDDDWFSLNIKFRNDAYVTFSILGLALIFGIGGLILVLTVLMMCIIPAIQKRTGKGEYRRQQWHSNDILNLQRTLFEDRGLGTWEGAIDEIPTTKTAEKFPPLNSDHVVSETKECLSDVSTLNENTEYKLDMDLEGRSMLSTYDSSESGSAPRSELWKWVLHCRMHWITSADHVCVA